MLSEVLRLQKTVSQANQFLKLDQPMLIQSLSVDDKYVHLKKVMKYIPN